MQSPGHGTSSASAIVTFPLRSNPNASGESTDKHVWNSREDTIPFSLEFHCDDSIAKYFETVAGLSPSALTSEDWRAVRSAMAPSPESCISFNTDDLNIWSLPNSNESSQPSENSSCRTRGDRPCIQTATVSEIGGLTADAFIRPSRRELSRSYSALGCPRAPDSSPVDRSKIRKGYLSSISN